MVEIILMSVTSGSLKKSASRSLQINSSEQFTVILVLRNLYYQHYFDVCDLWVIVKAKPEQSNQTRFVTSQVNRRDVNEAFVESSSGSET
jgi:hypothetical protein